MTLRSQLLSWSGCSCWLNRHPWVSRPNVRDRIARYLSQSNCGGHNNRRHRVFERRLGMFEREPCLCPILLGFTGRSVPSLQLLGRINAHTHGQSYKEASVSAFLVDLPLGRLNIGRRMFGPVAPHPHTALHITHLCRIGKHSSLNRTPLLLGKSDKAVEYSRCVVSKPTKEMTLNARTGLRINRFCVHSRILTTEGGRLYACRPQTVKCQPSSIRQFESAPRVASYTIGVTNE